jgi:hypothetical protein
MKFVVAALAIASAFVVYNRRVLRLRTAARGRKLLAVSKEAARGKLNDRIVRLMLETLSSEYIDAYTVQEDIVHKAGLELGLHGTPDSCLLAMYISNYSGMSYPESTNEIIREAACHFTSPHHDSRTVDIVQGKYLFEDSIGDSSSSSSSSPSKSAIA